MFKLSDKQIQDIIEKLTDGFDKLIIKEDKDKAETLRLKEIEAKDIRLAHSRVKYGKMLESQRKQREKPVIESHHQDLSYITDTKSDNFLKAVTTHKLTGTHMYSHWQAMKGKARDKGLPVCNEWINDPKRFIDDMQESYDNMGDIRPALVMIDKNGMYSKDNCTVVSLSEASVSRSKAVNQLDKNGTYIASYGSSVDAANAIGGHASKINAVCNGKRKSSGGFVWEFN